MLLLETGKTNCGHTIDNESTVKRNAMPSYTGIRRLPAAFYSMRKRPKKYYSEKNYISDYHSVV